MIDFLPILLYNIGMENFICEVSVMRTYLKSNFFSRGESVDLWYISETDCNEEEHMHEFLELIYTVSGKLTHRIDGKAYTAVPNTLLFVNPKQIHSIESSGNVEFVNILIKPDFISEYAVDEDSFYNIFRFFLSDRDEIFTTETQLVKFSGSEAHELKNLVNYMLAEKENLLPGWSVALNGYARILFAKLFRALRKTEKDEKTVFLDIMDYLINYIDQNYAEPLTLSSLATKCYFNPSYISRQFKKFSGKGFKEYLTEKRITEAGKFLTETDMSIEEIQERIGFTDKTKFYKEFSNYYDCTPGQYRKTREKSGSGTINRFPKEPE